MFVQEMSKKVRKIFHNQNMKYTDLEKLSGVSRKTLSGFILNAENTTLGNVCNIGNGLGLDINFETVREEIGNNIRLARESRDLSMSGLARLMGVSHASLSSYESYEGNITLDMIERISKALDISPFDLYAFSEFEVYKLDVENLEINYTYPQFDKDTLNREFSIKKDLYNGATKKVELAYVIDGDTITCIIDKLQYRVRLAVIDTPETIKKSNKWGKVATDFTKRMIEKANGIYLQLDTKVETMDSWKRVIAWAWLDYNGELKLLQSLIVQAGLAEVKYIDNSESLYVPILLEQEQEAKSNKRILWGYRDIDPHWDYLTNKPKMPYWVVQVNDKFIKVNDYEMHIWSVEVEGTRFRFKEDAEYIQKHVRNCGYQNINVVIRI